MTITAIDVKALVPEGTNLIGGEFVPAKSGQVIEIVDPGTQEVISTVARGTKEDVDAAVEAAALTPFEPLIRLSQVAYALGWGVPNHICHCINLLVRFPIAAMVYYHSKEKSGARWPRCNYSGQAQQTK